MPSPQRLSVCLLITISAVYFDAGRRLKSPGGCVRKGILRKNLPNKTCGATRCGDLRIKEQPKVVYFGLWLESVNSTELGVLIQYFDPLRFICVSCGICS